jgi:hypothetical protein
MSQQTSGHKSPWRYKVSSFFFGLLVIAVIAGVLVLAIWYEGKRSDERHACEDAEMAEAYDRFGPGVYSDERFQQRAEDACATGP